MGSIQKASIRSIKPYGVFVQMEGFRSNALVHLSQVPHRRSDTVMLVSSWDDKLAELSQDRANVFCRLRQGQPSVKAMCQQMRSAMLWSACIAASYYVNMPSGGCMTRHQLRAALHNFDCQPCSPSLQDMIQGLLLPQALHIFITNKTVACQQWLQSMHALDHASCDCALPQLLLYTRWQITWMLTRRIQTRQR